MIPPRRKPAPPPRQLVPAGFIKLQPNRLFDNEAEILATYPDAKIIKTWKTNQIACEILIPEPKSHVTSTSKKNTAR
jgi:hypothetical protein